MITKEDYIKHEIMVWGEDHIFDLIDRGYEPVQLRIPGGNGELRWWWINRGNDEKPHLTQTAPYATLPASQSVVSPVSAD